MGDGTVTDCRTGLTWLKNANCTDSSGGITNPTGELNWYDAMKWAAGLGSGKCGLTDHSEAGDWRLPAKAEWMEMVASARKQGFTSPALTNDAGTGHWTSGAVGNSFVNVQSNCYWSSIPCTGYPGYIWIMPMPCGSANTMADPAITSFINVWPVRAGQSGTLGNLLLY